MRCVPDTKFIQSRLDNKWALIVGNEEEVGFIVSLLDGWQGVVQFDMVFEFEDSGFLVLMCRAAAAAL